MDKLSEKIFLQLKMPDEEAPISDQNRIRLALETLGYSPVAFPLPVLQRLNPLCREAGFDVTVTLVRREYDWAIVDIESGDTTGHHYALAVDYGSTTIVMQLVDQNSGAVVGEAKEFNGQARYGSDILTRITYAIQGAEQQADLQKATVATLESLLGQLTQDSGMDAFRCPVMVLSGNTAMVHFLLKLNPWTIFAAPYAPVSSDPGFLWGNELGMDFPGLVYLVPSASNYVGGDIISGLLALEMHKKEEIGLFFDIGTNGELVIGNKDWMAAGAGAAGPALEGYISQFGMRADRGAIDSIAISGADLSFTTIGQDKPKGICGSGIIDLLAQMRLAGWIDIAGQLNPEASSRIQHREGEYVAVYALPEESASGEALYFSQTDIMQYLDTKAAAYTMVECLLETAGVDFGDLGALYLSGAFPYHSDLESAIQIGMFPDIPRERYQVRRNSSLDGARAILQNAQLIPEAKSLAENMYCVQFASYPDFLVRMQAAKFIPHTDMGRYPSVQERSNQMVKPGIP